MKILKDNIIRILIVLINMLFSFQIIKQSYLIVDYKILYVLIIYIAATFAYCILNTVIKNNVKRLMLLFVGLALIALYLYRSSFFIRLTYDIEANVSIISNSVANAAATYFDQYKIFFIILVPILVFFFLFISERGCNNIIILYTLSIMILFWFIGFSNIVIEYIKWYIPLTVVSYAFNNYSSALKKLRKKNYKFNDARSKIVYFTILPAILVTLIVSNLPREYAGNYESQIKGKLTNNYASKNSNSLSKSAYGLELSGYSDSSEKLGGTLVLNNDLVLKIKASKPEYLRGVVKDFYTGDMWKRTKTTYEKKVQSDGNLFSSNAELLNKLNNADSMTIYPVNTKTTSIFAPMYTYDVSLPKGAIYFDKIPTFIGDLKNSDSYTLKYYATKETESFENCKDLSWLSEDRNTQEIDNFALLYNDYLQQPDTITDRTKELQQELIKNSRNRYEVIESIQNYLSKSFPYSLTVSANIESGDFVDDFLFNEKKGYCVYFASAAAMLCRMSGIPARYVEGFKMYDNKNSKGLYEVTNAEAHAWCEVLVDPQRGLWSVLEATPGILGATGSIANSAVTTPTVPVVANPSSSTEKSKAEINSSKGDLSKETIKTKGIHVSKLQIMLFIFSLLIVSFLIKIATAIKAIKKIIASDSMIPLYKYTMKRLNQIGIVKPDNMAELEYAQTISDFQLKVLVRKLSTNLYEEFYGKKKVRGVDKLLMYKELESYIKYSQSKTAYFIKKYLFL